MRKTVVLALLGVFVFGGSAAAQRGAWRPATQAEWKRPPVVEWQRSLDDALAVSSLTKRPILVCVNMDGEAASEHYAGVRYRDPEFAKLTAGYVPVVASPDRHAPQDYDVKGNRVLCPRFGRVTCSEHIRIEPELYDRYFNKNRVAPRHLGAAPDGKVLFDCFLNMDIAPVLKAIGENAHAGLTPAKGSTADAWLKSRDAADRVKLEDAYRAGDVKARVALLEAASKAKGAEPFDLVRLGLRDGDSEARRAARAALAATASVHAVPLLSEALRQSVDASERKVLSDALLTLAKGDLRARRAVALARALDAKSTAIDVNTWKGSLGKATGAPVAELDPDELERRIQSLDERVKSQKSDGRAALDLARANLEFAELRMAAQKNPTLLFDDAAAALNKAKDRGAAGPEASALEARLLYHRGEVLDAGEKARASLTWVLTVPASRDARWSLWIVAAACRARIAESQAKESEWPTEWLTDGHAALTVLAAHPWSTPEQLTAHYDLLTQVGAPEPASAAIAEAVRRFPEAAPVHERFRASLLETGGVEALEKAYDKERAANVNSAGLLWFSGYASLVTAEFRVRAGEVAAARAAYDRAREHFDASVSKNADFQATADHFAALALAGKARMSLDEGNLDAATADLCAALERCPGALDAEDGLGRSPHATARALRWSLDEGKRAELREKLEAALEAIDPELASRPAK